MECFVGFPSLRKTVSPQVENYEKFLRVFGGRQSTADMPLALFSTMNRWQHILFLKSELSELLFSKMFIK